MIGRDRERVLGVEVDAITRAELQARVIDCVRAGTRLWVSNHNLHSAYLTVAGGIASDDGFHRWNDLADLVFVDGMSVVLASWLTGGRLRRHHRATLLDWMPGVLAAAARDGKVVFHLGGDPAWIERGAAAWRAEHPGLDLHLHHGYFPPADSRRVLAEINRVRPDLLLVGMGMPLQERWAADHADEVTAPVIVTVGAFMGIAAGVRARPPRWVGDLGFEWAWRLATDPRRHGRRYLVEPVVLARELVRGRAR